MISLFKCNDFLSETYPIYQTSEDAKKRLKDLRRTEVTAVYKATGAAKADAAFDEIVTLFNNDNKKIVVFAHHQNVLDAIESVISHAVYNWNRCSSFGLTSIGLPVLK